MKLPAIGKLTAILALFVASQAQAGARDLGNGGHSVVCRDGATRLPVQATLLDYFEGEIYRGIRADLGPPELGVEGKMELLLGRIARFSPDMAARYRRGYETFHASSRFVKGVRLVITSDSHEQFIPEGCQIEQTVVRRVPRFAEDRKYTINQEIWDALDADGKAGMILHELVYEETQRNGHADSFTARYFNSRLSSPEIEKLSKSEFVDLLWQVFPVSPISELERDSGSRREVRLERADGSLAASLTFFGSFNQLSVYDRDLARYDSDIRDKKLVVPAELCLSREKDRLVCSWGIESTDFKAGEYVVVMNDGYGVPMYWRQGKFRVVDAGVPTLGASGSGKFSAEAWGLETRK